MLKVWLTLLAIQGAVTPSLTLPQAPSPRPQIIGETIKKVTEQLMNVNLTSDVTFDTRTPPRVKQQQKLMQKEQFENSHAGVAIPVDEESILLEESTKKSIFYKNNKPTTDSGLSTWILLSGQNNLETTKPTRKAVIKPLTNQEVQQNIEEHSFVNKQNIINKQNFAVKQNLTELNSSNVNVNLNKLNKPLFKKRPSTTTKKVVTEANYESLPDITTQKISTKKQSLSTQTNNKKLNNSDKVKVALEKTTDAQDKKKQNNNQNNEKSSENASNDKTKEDGNKTNQENYETIKDSNNNETSERNKQGNVNSETNDKRKQGNNETSDKRKQSGSETNDKKKQSNKETNDKTKSNNKTKQSNNETNVKRKPTNNEETNDKLKQTNNEETNLKRKQTNSEQANLKRKQTSNEKIEKRKETNEEAIEHETNQNEAEKQNKQNQKLTKIKASLLTNALNKTNNKTQNSTVKKQLTTTTMANLESSTELLIKLDEIKPIKSNELPLEAKNSEVELNSTTATSKKAKRPNSKRKKTKNKKNKKPNLEKNGTNSTKTSLSQKEKPIGTQIYNYLSREVMPTVGVGLVGLMVTAGLASYFLYPFGPLRRSYDVDRKDKDGGYYYSDYTNGGVAEEEMIGKVIAGMPDNSFTGYSSRNGYPSLRKKNVEYRPVYTAPKLSTVSTTTKNYDKEIVVQDSYYSQNDYGVNPTYKHEKKPTYSSSTNQQFVVGNIPKEVVPEVTPVAVPEHGPRMLKIRRRRSLKEKRKNLKKEGTKTSSKNSKSGTRKAKSDEAILTSEKRNLEEEERLRLKGKASNLKRKLNLKEKGLTLKENAVNLKENAVNLKEKQLNLKETPLNLKETHLNLKELSLNLKETPLNLKNTQFKLKDVRYNLRKKPFLVRKKRSENEILNNEIPNDLKIKFDEIQKLNDDDNKKITASIEDFDKVNNNNNKIANFSNLEIPNSILNKMESTTKKQLELTTQKNQNFADQKPKPNFFDLLKDLLNFKIRLGLEILQNTTQTFSRYLNRVQERLDSSKES